jgi:hypothetical protein
LNRQLLNETECRGRFAHFRRKQRDFQLACTLLACRFISEAKSQDIILQVFPVNCIIVTHKALGTQFHIWRNLFQVCAQTNTPVREHRTLPAKNLHKFRQLMYRPIHAFIIIRLRMYEMHELDIRGNVSSLRWIHRQMTCCNKAKTDLILQSLR